MKSVFNKVFAYSHLMLASVAAHATADNYALAHVIAQGGISLNDNAAVCILSLDVTSSTYPNFTLDALAATDEGQADSAEAETMLA